MSKPLTTSLGDALAAKPSTPPSLVPLRRPSPPAARPSRIPVYSEAPPPPQLHALPPPEGPDRASIANDGAEVKPTKKRAYARAPDDVKAAAVRRVLAGNESRQSVADDLGVSSSAIALWIKEAKATAQKETAVKFEASDIEKVSKELTEALALQRTAAERVKVLKAQLRKLIGDD